MIKLLKRLALVVLLAALNACVSNPSMSAGADYFPGGSPFYSFGVSQSKENFENIARAQSDYGLYPNDGYWDEIRPMRALSSINMLQAYYALHVRWQLKDGRQFIAENVDVRAAMNEYFKTHQIMLQHQREGRAWDSVGDSHPSLGYEVKDDGVILKWTVTTNKTPVKERLQPNGAANRWYFDYQEYIVTTIKGRPTSGIDFDNRVLITK